MAFIYASSGFFAWIPGAKDWLDSRLEKYDDVLSDLISFNGSFYFLTWGYNSRVADAAYAYATVQNSIGFDDHVDTQFYEVKMSPDSRYTNRKRYGRTTRSIFGGVSWEDSPHRKIYKNLF
ncbi:hypothetical protein Ddye_027431 [Dipteronia dyeriana]|uniref:Uncharacterized protein n=1 Tax=Dipteronia dyeriana TaxID=168575 RepID=A0AAD9TPR1_9ROSI|nr:hypothetical protein Ddye_027431 [Dipteronia dyeriana]